MEWIISLDAIIPGTFTDELADRVIEDLKDYSPAVGGREGRVGVTMTVEAPIDRQAHDHARSVLQGGVLGPRSRVLEARLQTVDELERELEVPPVPASKRLRL